jgi:transcriptional regulator with XRE-family HTH domain
MSNLLTYEPSCEFLCDFAEIGTDAKSRKTIKMRAVGTFGDNLGRAIAMRGWQKQQLAERAKTTPDIVSRWLKADNVELTTLLRLATALEMSVERLVADIDPDYERWKASRPVVEQLLILVEQLPTDHLRPLMDLVRATVGLRESAATSDSPEPAH